MNSDEINDDESVQKQQDGDFTVAIEAATSEKKADSEGAHSGTPEKKEEKRDNKTVRVTQRSSIRKLVSYVIMRVKAGDTITV